MAAGWSHIRGSVKTSHRWPSSSGSGVTVPPLFLVCSYLLSREPFWGRKLRTQAADIPGSSICWILRQESGRGSPKVCTELRFVALKTQLSILVQWDFMESHFHLVCQKYLCDSSDFCFLTICSLPEITVVLRYFIRFHQTLISALVI